MGAGFPRSLIAVGKESACKAGHLGSIPGSGRSLEKEMATHSSILAWRIPWTEEPRRLQFMGSQTVGHDLATKPPPTIFTRICEKTSIYFCIIHTIKTF